MEGPDALRDHLRQWEETFAEGRMEVEELIDAGDQVVALVRAIGRMKDSDAEIDLRYAIVFTIRDGKIATGREYFTREKPSKPPGCRSSCAVTPRPRSPAERVPPVYLWIGERPGTTALHGER